MWLLSCGAVLAAGLDSFAGTWVLDVAASDPPGALMEAQGFSWVERQAAARMSVTQVMQVGPGRVDLEVRSMLRNESETLLLDDAWRPQDGRQGPAEVRHRLEADGALVTEIRQTVGTGCPCSTAVRRMVDGDRLEQVITWTPASGAPVTLRRILQKAVATATDASATPRP